jgi:mono/diheme cytochrome c family protein
MSHITRFVLLASVCLFSAGSALAQQAPAAPAGDAKAGEKLFMSDGCQECHGKVAQGAPATGVRLAPGPIPFQNFITQLRDPRGEMPPYEAVVLSDKEAADIYAFLQAIPKQPDYKTIPLLSGS